MYANMKLGSRYFAPGRLYSIILERSGSRGSRALKDNNVISIPHIKTSGGNERRHGSSSAVGGPGWYQYDTPEAGDWIENIV